MTAAYLKEQTKPLHDALEQKMMVSKIFNRTLKKDVYFKILKVNLLVHQKIEPVINSNIPDNIKSELNIEERQKTPHLINDIGSLNENINSDFQLNNSDEALGALYVLEGASLGGNVIKKQLLQNPEFADVSFHYYGMYGENLAENWKSFLKVLEENVSDKDAALSGANKTYQLFLQSAEAFIQ